MAARSRCGRVAAVGEVVLLSLTASLNPTLLATTTLMLLLPKPSRLMLGYLLGATLTSVTLGLVIVFSLSGSSSTTNTTQSTLSPAVAIALGALAVSFAVAPDWTPQAIDRAKAWVGRHAHSFAVKGLTLVGALLVIKGIVGLVT